MSEDNRWTLIIGRDAGRSQQDRLRKYGGRDEYQIAWFHIVRIQIAPQRRDFAASCQIGVPFDHGATADYFASRRAIPDAKYTVRAKNARMVEYLEKYALTLR